MVPFPAQLDDKEQILRLIGGFWSDTYEGQDLLAEALRARYKLTEQTFERLQEASDCRSRLNVPLFRHETWRYLSISSKDIANFPNLYGENNNYNDSSVYGKRSPTLPFFCPFPEDIADCALITNRLSNSSVTLVRGLDFSIDNAKKIIRFNNNPFNDDRIVKQKTDDGHEEVILWMYKPKIDRQYVFYHFGHVINMWAKSSPEYKAIVNNVYDCLCDGTSIGKTLDAISIATGIPLAKGGETVQYIEDDKLHKLVLTDKNAYKFSKRATVSVSVGDELSQDQPMTGGFTYAELNRGLVPAGVHALSLSPEVLSKRFVNEIGFSNGASDLVVESDLNGKTKVSFELGGHPFDVEEFWNEVHERGLSTGKTLASYLDTRTNKVGEPEASNLPASINPLAFLAENLFRYGAMIVRINAADVLDNAVGVDKLSYVRRLLPPHTHLFLILSLPSIEEDVNLYEDGYVPETDTFTAANTLEDEIDQTDTQETIIGRVVSGGCL